MSRPSAAGDMREMATAEEAERIKRVYDRRDSDGKDTIYSFFRPAALFMYQQREKEILKTLCSEDMRDISGEKILEVGCGDGSVLRDFLRYGARPENCFGVDLLPWKIDEARRLSPNIDFRCCNAERLPFRGGAFDIILCITVFTSILDMEMKRNLAGEMERVLKRGGVILWCDFHMDNPKNADVRGIKMRELRDIFRGLEIRMRRVILAPPLARAIAPIPVCSVIFLNRRRYSIPTTSAL
ncbi:MAG: class I SAM-dependent methyltransferase [Nitrospiraceae bacterium]|nr:class I SAM-dependent methyltransferase [Nitrospiraceae bacterium]